VSLVSVKGRNWCYLCGTVERVAECETVEIANVNAGFVHVAEKMVGWQKRLGEYPTLSATSISSSLRGHMSLRTVEQVRRAFRIIIGFTLLLIGVVMLVTPGPGWFVILLGLGLLAAEFVWARRLMDRIKRESNRVRDAVLTAAKSVTVKESQESNDLD
jgi:uncharacterized protein (TIGR02611 family)